MLHLVAEAAEMGANEEVAMDGVERPERAAVDGRLDAAGAFVEAAVLADRVDFSGGRGAGDEIAGLGHRGRHRLFAEDVAAAGEGGCHHVVACGGDHDVEEEIGLELGEHGIEIGAGRRRRDRTRRPVPWRRQLRYRRGRRPRPSLGQQRRVAQRGQPAFRHRTAAAKNCAELPVSQGFPSTVPDGGVIGTVRALSVNPHL